MSFQGGPIRLQTEKQVFRQNPVHVVSAPSESAESIAEAISENMEKLVGADPKPETPPASAPSGQKQNTRPLRMDSATIKFTDLQFGKNYDPTNG